LATDVITKLQKDVQNTIEQLGLKETMITVAVSGGPDSLCMLHALHSISKDTGISLWGAHLDHKIRGRESKEDAEFVKTSPPSAGFSEVLYPGEIEFKTEQKRRAEGIFIEDETWKQITELMAELNVQSEVGDPF